MHGRAASAAAVVLSFLGSVAATALLTLYIRAKHFSLKPSAAGSQSSVDSDVASSNVDTHKPNPQSKEQVKSNSASDLKSVIERKRSLSKSKASKVEKTTHELVAEYMMLCTIVTSVIYCLLLFSFHMGELKLVPFVACAWSRSLLAYIWILSRHSLYAVLTARVAIAFDNSAFAYSPRLIYGFYVLELLLWCGQSANNGVFVRRKRVDSHKLKICVAKGHPMVFASVLMIDMVVSLSLVWMFCRPLRKLKKASTRRSYSVSVVSGSSTFTLERQAPGSEVRRPRSSQEIEELEFEMLPLRYVVCASVAVASTFAFLFVLASTGYNGLGAIDSSVNVACLILMTGHFSKHFWVIGRPLLVCIVNCNCLIDPSTHDAVHALISFHNGHSQL